MRGLVRSTTQMSGSRFQCGQGQQKKTAFMPAGENKEISFILGLLETTIGRQTASGHQHTRRGSEYEYYTVGGRRGGRLAQKGNI